MGAPELIVPGTSSGTAPVGGTGTTNYIPRWTGASTLGDSVIAQSGSNIGIGTASPNGQLQLSRSMASGNWLVLDDTRAGFGDWSFYKSTANDLTIGYDTTGGTSPTQAVTFAYGGNVGIGTASPSAKLEIASTSSGGAQFRLSNAAGLTNWWEIGRDNATTGALIFASNTGERMRISPGTSQVAIGTSSFTTGRALTTVADVDIYGVLVGRGPGASTTNTVVGGAGAALSLTTGTSNTAIGAASQAATTSGSRNTTVGEGTGYTIQTSNDNTHVGRFAGTYHSGSSNTAVGSGALTGASGLSVGANNTAVGAFASQANTTGAVNVGVGFQALLSNTNGASNVAVGAYALGTTNGGSSNIALGREATTAAAGDSNQLVLGSATYYVATNGGATTYYATAGALLGYMQIRLNGANVKIPVYAP